MLSSDSRQEYSSNPLPCHYVRTGKPGIDLKEVMDTGGDDHLPVSVPGICENMDGTDCDRTLGVSPSDNTWEDDSDDVVLLQLGTLSLCAHGRMTSWL